MLDVLRYREGTDEPESVTLETAGPFTGDAVVWADCSDPTDDDLTTVGKTLGLHEFVLEDLRHAEQRTKLDHHSDHFHVAVHDCCSKARSSRRARSTSCSAKAGWSPYANPGGSWPSPACPCAYFKPKKWL